MCISALGVKWRPIKTCTMISEQKIQIHKNILADLLENGGMCMGFKPRIAGEEDLIPGMF